MDMRIAVFILTLVAASLALATGTGPTLPEKSREHPLDTREPRQDVIDRNSGSQDQPKPPTFEAPPEVSPEEQVPQDGDESRSANDNPASAR
jgi:hypothetical protein